MLYPNGNKEEHKSKIGISLKLDSACDGAFDAVSYTFSLMDTKYKKVVEKNPLEKTQCMISKFGFGCPNFLSHDDLIKDASRLIATDKLTIICEVKF